MLLDDPLFDVPLLLLLEPVLLDDPLFDVPLSVVGGVGSGVGSTTFCGLISKLNLPKTLVETASDHSSLYSTNETS